MTTNDTLNGVNAFNLLEQVRQSLKIIWCFSHHILYVLHRYDKPYKASTVSNYSTGHLL